MLPRSRESSEPKTSSPIGYVSTKGNDDENHHICISGRACALQYSRVCTSHRYQRGLRGNGEPGCRVFRNHISGNGGFGKLDRRYEPEQFARHDDRKRGWQHSQYAQPDEPVGEPRASQQRLGKSGAPVVADRQVE